VNGEEYVLVAKVDGRIYMSPDGGSSWKPLDGSPRRWFWGVWFFGLGILLGLGFLAISTMVM